MLRDMMLGFVTRTVSEYLFSRLCMEKPRREYRRVLINNAPNDESGEVLFRFVVERVFIRSVSYDDIRLDGFGKFSSRGKSDSRIKIGNRVDCAVPQSFLGHSVSSLAAPSLRDSFFRSKREPAMAVPCLQRELLELMGDQVRGPYKRLGPLQINDNGIASGVG
nr:hypothetical protein CFP56_77646 [Quercus suber]